MWLRCHWERVVCVCGGGGEQKTRSEEKGGSTYRHEGGVRTVHAGPCPRAYGSGIPFSRLMAVWSLACVANVKQESGQG